MAVLVSCEWDLGHGLVSAWDTKEEAEAFYREAMHNYERELGTTYDEALIIGLISYEEGASNKVEKYYDDYDESQF